MTKAEYLERLRESLALMPAEEREAQLAYYEELFDDMLEDGMSEEQVVEHLGAPEAVAEELLAEMPLSTLVKNRVRAEGKLSALTIVLLVLGAPVWLPLLISAFAVLLSLLITLWAVGISLGVVLPAVGLALVGAGLGTLFGQVTLPILLALGAILCGVALLILGALLMGVIARGLAKLCRAVWRGCKKLLVK
ncbi:MAG: DUF1700 domain-containing protein [Clostridia bacterium]